MAKSKPTVHYRKAHKGTYTTKQYAAKHPTTTVKETDKPKRATKKS